LAAPGSFDCVVVCFANDNFAQDDTEILWVLGERRFKLRFEVKGQEYFLAFVEQENRLYVFAPTPTGMQRMPVYVDAVKWKTANSAEPRQLSS
jgi:hypothetical protein